MKFNSLKLYIEVWVSTRATLKLWISHSHRRVTSKAEREPVSGFYKCSLPLDCLVNPIIYWWTGILLDFIWFISFVFILRGVLLFYTGVIVHLERIVLLESFRTINYLWGFKGYGVLICFLQDSFAFRSTVCWLPIKQSLDLLTLYVFWLSRT